MHGAWNDAWLDRVASLTERVLTRTEEVDDLRSRLSLFADFVCEGCGCATSYDVSREYCLDCWEVRHGVTSGDYHAAACVSVGLRALCGRRILEGC